LETLEVLGFTVIVLILLLLGGNIICNGLNEQKQYTIEKRQKILLSGR